MVDHFAALESGGVQLRLNCANSDVEVGRKSGSKGKEMGGEVGVQGKGGERWV